MKIGTIIGIIASIPVIGLALYMSYIFLGWWGILGLLGIFAYTAYQEVVHGRFIWSEKDTITILKDGKVKVYEEK